MAPARRRRTAGYTMLEAVISISFGVLLLLGLYATFSGASQSLSSGDTISDLQEQGRRVLVRVLDELRETAIRPPVPLGTATPAIWERDPDAEPFERTRLLGTLSFADLSLAERPGEIRPHADRRQRNRLRVSNELVFFKPLFESVNHGAYRYRRPVTSSGELVFDEEREISLLVVKHEDEYRLERWVDKHPDSVLGNDVRKIAFDILGFDATVPYNQVAVTIYLQRTSSDGTLLECALEGTVNLRNSREPRQEDLPVPENN